MIAFKLRVKANFADKKGWFSPPKFSYIVLTYWVLQKADFNADGIFFPMKGLPAGELELSLMFRIG